MAETALLQNQLGFSFNKLIMRNKNLKISKTITPNDWNPNDPSGYNDWMKMIVQENLKTEGVAIVNTSNKIESPKPRLISEIFGAGLSASMNGIENILGQATKISEGGTK